MDRPTFINRPGVMKVVKIIAGVVFALNAITGITVICLVNKRHSRSSPYLKQRMQELKQSLDDVYHQSRQSVSKSWGTHASNQGTERPSLEFLSLLKPVAHLSGLDFDRKEKGVTQSNRTIRNWAVSEGSERNLMYNGVTYENGSFVIPITGTYFVYSHVKFYVEDNKKASHQDVFHHKLLQYSALGMTENTILSNQVTECKEGINDGAHLEYPSDIRGVVLLNAGDQLKVKVSNFSLLKHDRDWHYTGVYLL